MDWERGIAALIIWASANRWNTQAEVERQLDMIEEH